MRSDRPRLLVAERLQQRLQRGLGPGVDERAVDLPAADHVRAPEVLYVDYAHRAGARQAGAGEGKRLVRLERLAHALLDPARGVAELARRLLVARPEGDAVGRGDQLAQVRRLAHHLADQRADRGHRLHQRGRHRRASAPCGRLTSATISIASRIVVAGPLIT